MRSAGSRRRLTAGFSSIVAIGVIGVAAPAAADEVEADDGPPMVAAEIVVKIDLESGATIEEINAEHGTTTIDPMLASRGIYLIAGPAQEDPKDVERLAKQIAKDDRLEYAEVNHDTDTTDDDRFHAWGSDGGRDGTEGDGEGAGAHAAFDALDLGAVHMTVTGRGVVVAVLDTGVDAAHPAFSGRLVAAWDYVGDDPDPDDEADGLDTDGDGRVDEAHGHGTHVAGIVLAVAPDATIWPARVLDSDGRGRAYVIAEAIYDAVDAGVDVINLSFGVSGTSESKLLTEALRYATKHKVLVVAAAGNAGDEVEHFPAADKDVLGVSGLGGDGVHLAGFSNRGKWVDVAAPAVGVVGPLPGGGYARWDGTSMAAPIVSGQAALLKSADPDLDGKQLRRAIRKYGRETLDDKPIESIDVRASLDGIR